MDTFSIKDKIAWGKICSVNADPYGGLVLSYAARWAALMEGRMRDGQRLEDVAKATSHDADAEGITEFMYGAAVSTLARCWEHGETLRRWHNSATQLHDDGDRANADGGVLNPAVLRVG